MSAKKEILVLACDGGEVLRAANRLLKSRGLKLKLRKSRGQGDDQRYLSLEGDRVLIVGDRGPVECVVSVEKQR